MRGALANVRNARWDAVDADGASDVRAGGVRRSRVVLVSRCWHQARGKRKFLAGDGGKRAVLRGEHEASRKAIAQGRPGCSACTCMLVCAFLVRKLHTGPRVQRAPGLPCALIFSRGQQTMQNSGKRCREKEKPHQFVIASRPSHATLSCKHDSSYDASLAKALQSRGQSSVPKMSPFKLQMTGATVPLFFCSRVRLEMAMT